MVLTQWDTRQELIPSRANLWRKHGQDAVNSCPTRATRSRRPILTPPSPPTRGRLPDGEEHRLPTLLPPVSLCARNSSNRKQRTEVDHAKRTETESGRIIPTTTRTMDRTRFRRMEVRRDTSPARRNRTGRCGRVDRMARLLVGRFLLPRRSPRFGVDDSEPRSVLSGTPRHRESRPSARSLRDHSERSPGPPMDSSRNDSARELLAACSSPRRSRRVATSPDPLT